MRNRALTRKRSEILRRHEIQLEHRRAIHKELVYSFVTIIYCIMWSDDSFRTVSDTHTECAPRRACILQITAVSLVIKIIIVDVVVVVR